MNHKVKAITLYQPWASLIVAGAKRFETRHWGTAYRGPLVIHAGRTLEVDTRNRLFVRFLMESGIGDWNRLPLGAAVGVTWLQGCWRGQSVLPHIDEREQAFGYFNAPERVAWEMVNPVAFEQPIPMRGKQGLWDWPLPLPDAVLAQFEQLMGQQHESTN